MCPPANAFVVLATQRETEEMIGAICMYTQVGQLSFEYFAEMISEPDDHTSLQLAIEEIADYIRYKSVDDMHRGMAFPEFEQEAVETVMRFAYKKLDRI